MEYTAYIGTGNPVAHGGGDVWIAGQNLEKFEAQVIGFYCNRYIQLDAKSGMVGESVLSEQFANSLRLAGGAQLLDLNYSMDYRKGHIEGAVWH